MGPPALAVPSEVVENAAVGERLGVAPQWIERRTGVRSRRRAAAGERLSTRAAEAGRAALDRAGIAPHELDLVLVATITADEIVPNAAPVVAAELGADQAGALDLGAGCCGFLAGMQLASGAIESGRAERVLLIGADFMSRLTDRDDRPTAGLLGDGAGAVTIVAGDGPAAIGPVTLHVDPAGPPLAYARRDEGVMRMDGPETFRIAVLRVAEVLAEALERADATVDDVDLFVFHQANSRILAAVGERMGLDEARVVNCIGCYGNTSAASIPIALATAYAEGRLDDGGLIAFGAIGTGFVYGACLMRWEPWT
ncbi:MAG TPA: beta-ketoacyl-ACP synthase 3 [Solirubrobacteraceae bacterium]|nr:beta-ketoacyl-ACP synthase 3 [Solirubrobacteraceae bacterium]